jgi:hypothetical protein
MIGKVVTRQKILDRLNGRGMGEVYRDQDLKLNRPIALKFLALTLRTRMCMAHWLVSETPEPKGKRSRTASPIRPFAEEKSRSILGLLNIRRRLA